MWLLFGFGCLGGCEEGFHVGRTMFRRWRASAAVLAALLVAGPFAPQAQAQSQSPANGGHVLRVALVQEVDHLNPFLASFASSTMLGRLAWEFLTLPSAQDNTPAPGLAESWDTSPDKLTWTYHIRQGVT